MSQKAQGLVSATQLAGGMQGLAVEEQQADLFEPDAPLPVSPRGVSGPQGGRPKGARNRSTEEWRQYLLSRYRSPLVGLLEICARTPKELAEELGLEHAVVVIDVEGKEIERRSTTDVREAFRIQVDAMKAALPYLHQRQPLAVEQRGNERGVLVIGDLNVAVDAGDGLPLVPEIEGEAHTDDAAVGSE